MINNIIIYNRYSILTLILEKLKLLFIIKLKLNYNYKIKI